MKSIKKKLIRDSGSREYVQTEKEILSIVDHPFIIKMHCSFHTELNLFFILDFVNGGELFHHLQLCDRFDEERTRFYAAEIFLSLKYLHKLGIAYRDLKPENILLGSDGHIVLTDFGLSKIIQDDDSALESMCGTPEYLVFA